MDVFAGPSAGAAPRYLMAASSAVFAPPNRRQKAVKQQSSLVQGGLSWKGADSSHGTGPRASASRSAFFPLFPPAAAATRTMALPTLAAAGAAGLLRGPGGPPPADTMLPLIQLETLKLLHSTRKKSGAKGGSDDSDTDDDVKDKRLGRELRRIMQVREWFAQHPERITQAFVDRLRRELGGSQFWKC